MLTKYLAVYSAALTTLLAVSHVYTPANAAAKIQEFDELTIHRMNVRERDGTLRLVIANRERMPGVIIRGKEAPRTDRPQAGMIFYNDEGTENGGLVFSGHQDATGRVVDSGVSLSFDRYGATSQFVQLAGVQDSANHIVGLTISDTEPNAGNRRRVVVGPDRQGAARVALMDAQGRQRMVLEVTSAGVPTLSFLDANGNVTNQVGAGPPR